MESLILNASNGNKSAVTTLYNNNKNKVYSVAYCILENKEKAERVVLDVFSKIWYELEKQTIQTENDFLSQCYLMTLTECKKVILRSDSKALQPPKNKNFIINTEKKAANWKDAIADFSQLQKFVFISRVLCGLSQDDISKIIFVDYTTLKLIMDAEKINLNKTFSLSEAEKSLLNDSRQMKFAPADSTEILVAIDKYVEPFEKLAWIKKIKIITIVLAVCVVIAALFGVYVLFSEKNPSSSNNTSKEPTSTVSTPDVDWVTSVTATDYAVIDIKDYGKISVALDENTAPITVANFKKLANSGFYEGLTFHRIIEGFMMQGGNGRGNDKDADEIKGEFLQNGVSNNLSHVRGAISMARTDVFDSASSQFFIVHKDSTFLDTAYAAFGYVVDGMDVVDKVCTDSKPTDNNGTIPAAQQPIINSVKIYSVEEFESLNNSSSETSDNTDVSVDSSSTSSEDENVTDDSSFAAESKSEENISNESSESKK